MRTAVGKFIYSWHAPAGVGLPYYEGKAQQVTVNYDVESQDPFQLADAKIRRQLARTFGSRQIVVDGLAQVVDFPK